jgi:DNA-directed RNA polymerase specialized sigma24 family protein
VDGLALVAKAISGDADASRTLVRDLAPIIQARVARALVRRRGGSGRDVRQEVEDITQEIFVALFSDEGRVLRAWDPARGLSLANFVGLVAEREAASILRSGRRSPWTDSPSEMQEIEDAAPPAPALEASLASRELLGRLVERVRESLSPRGLELFFRLIVDEEPVESVCATTQMTPDAVYAWRSRLAKLVRTLATELSDPASAPRTPIAAIEPTPP